MKHYANILFAVFLAAGLSTSKANTTVDYTFTIHIGAFLNAKLTDFENIRPYGYLYTQKFNNLLQIYMGDYSSEAAASKILKEVKNNGYPDAFITRRKLDDGEPGSVIQLGIGKIGSNIDWSYYIQAGPLQAYQDGKDVKIVTGPFENLEIAQQRLIVLRQIGFEEAFVKNVNTVLLHEVTEFETGGIATPTTYETIIAPGEPAEEVVIAEIPPKNKSTVPDLMTRKKGLSKKGGTPKEEARPKTYEAVIVPKSKPAAPVETAPAPLAKAKAKKKIASKTLASPTIRPKVKRTSVLRLQEVLKQEGTYKGSLDGYYGAGTKKGFENIYAKDREIQKYRLLSEIYSEEESETNEVQEIIDEMENDMAIGVSKLKSHKSPLSKAYQAYGIFKLSGKNKETDRLMNQAIKESFSSNKMKNKAPFDYKATYAYSSYKQFIKHLRYIHSASQEDIAVPCWLFENHKQDAIAAFDPANELTSGDYKIQDCGNILNWESLRLLKTIMMEMTPEPDKLSKKELALAQSKRAGLILFPQAQSVEDYKKIDAWNTKLWEGLDQWATADPLHQRFMKPLKIAYFQSWALLEDHFMNQGLNPKEARGLSLCVLETIVDPYFSRYY